MHEITKTPLTIRQYCKITGKNFKEIIKELRKSGEIYKLV